MKTAIIIPCYNEEKRLNQDEFISFILNNSDYHLCFINDGSKDNTLEVLHKMKSRAPHSISIVDMKENSGKATAVRSGVRYMYNKMDVTNIGFMDADLSTDFRDFKDLVKSLERENKLMVFGSRNCEKNKSIERDLLRNIFSKLVKQFILLILGLPIRDTQCGAKVFKKSIVPIVYQKSFISRWLFDVEIFLRLKKHFGKEKTMNVILEQPLMRWVHVDDSKLGMKDALEIPGRLAHIWINYTLNSSNSTSNTASFNTFAIPAINQEFSVA